MASEDVTRRLTTIVAADVVGYSRLTAGDEENTIAGLAGHRRELIDPLIAEHRGRIANTAGDSLLIESQSVVEAVRCAVDIQCGMFRRNDGIPPDSRINFRIGINLGDVIARDGDLLGDGVNVAARLEALAPAGGICVAEDVYRQIKNKADLRFLDLGEKELKNIPNAVRVYSVELGDGDYAPGPASSVASEPAARPAIAVMPFQNMSGDPDQEYFSDGLTEDIITALSAYRTFPVVARNTVFTYKGKPANAKMIAADTGARYVLEGSVRKGNNRVRIATQLIDVSTGHNLWGEKYDRNFDDVFEIQDEITQRIAAIVEPELTRAEGRRAAAKKPANMDAWDCFQRGKAQRHEYTKEGIALARAMFERAVELDPSYGPAYSGLSSTHQLDILLDHTEDRAKSITLQLKAARKTVDLDDSDWGAHTNLAYAYRWARQHGLAAAEAERAVELNPNNAAASAALGIMLDLSGRPEEGISFLEKAIRLNPRDPNLHFYMALLARSYLNARRYDSAVDWARKAIHRLPDHARAHAILAASLAHLGQTEAARTALAECERLKPGFAKRWILQDAYKDPADNEHMLAGLRAAGCDV